MNNQINYFYNRNQLIDELIVMQTKEGQALKKDIFNRITIIDKEIKGIEMPLNRLW